MTRPGFELKFLGSESMNFDSSQIWLTSLPITRIGHGRSPSFPSSHFLSTRLRVLCPPAPGSCLVSSICPSHLSEAPAHAELLSPLPCVCCSYHSISRTLPTPRPKVKGGQITLSPSLGHTGSCSLQCRIKTQSSRTDA